MATSEAHEIAWRGVKAGQIRASCEMRRQQWRRRAARRARGLYINLLARRHDGKIRGKGNRSGPLATPKRQ